MLVLLREDLFDPCTVIVQYPMFVRVVDSLKIAPVSCYEVQPAIVVHVQDDVARSVHKVDAVVRAGPTHATVVVGLGL